MFFLRSNQRKHGRFERKAGDSNTATEVSQRDGRTEEDPLSRSQNPLSAADPTFLKRADIHKHGHSPVDHLCALLETIRDICSFNQENLLGYIPTSIFMGLSVITLGLYPLFWFAQNVSAFIALSLERINEGYLRRYVVMGFFVQLMAVAAAVLGLLGRAMDSSLQLEYAFRFAFFYVFLTLFVLMPIRSFLYFGLRWNLRRAVAVWDSSKIMLPRTMPSWWKLFFFGSLYLQHHINRVIGLGMPGFADTDEVRESLPFLEWLGVYLTGFNELPSKGRR